MRFNLPTVFLASLALSSAAAIPKPAAVEERGLLGSLLQTIGCLTGQNAKSASAGHASWIGNDGDYVTEFNNESGEDLVLVMWGPLGSWTNVNAPLITYEITNGSSVNISTVTGTSGGWAALYEDTKMVNGQVSNTWGEFTYNGQYSTVDVSRLVNMNGRNMTIEGAECVSDMEQCVFTCDSASSATPLRTALPSLVLSLACTPVLPAVAASLARTTTLSAPPSTKLLCPSQAIDLRQPHYIFYDWIF
jgi:hypothetical protein